MAYTTVNKSTDYFNTKLYTGNGTTDTAITGIGFQPDWTWIKARDMAYDHNVMDSVRGSTKRIATNLDAAESTQAEMIKSFASDGFNLGDNGGVNQNTKTYVAYNWKANSAGSANTDGTINSTVSANTTSGFSIVKYTGNGSNNASVGHGLNVAPKIVFFKVLTVANDWRVQYSFVDGSRDRLKLNTTTDKYDSPSVTDNSNSLFYLDTGSEQNSNSQSYIAYCFAEKTGYSKFGYYTGNGSTDGPFIYTGFKPAWVLQKNFTNNSSNDWTLADNKRPGYNETNKRMVPNNTDTEAQNNEIDFLSNGFKIRREQSNTNASGNTYIYMAFAEAPLVGSNNVPCTAR